jgi:hypothetical protein
MAEIVFDIKREFRVAQHECSCFRRGPEPEARSDPTKGFLVGLGAPQAINVQPVRRGGAPIRNRPVGA